MKVKGLMSFRPLRRCLVLNEGVDGLSVDEANSTLSHFWDLTQMERILPSEAARRASDPESSLCKLFIRNNLEARGVEPCVAKVLSSDVRGCASREDSRAVREIWIALE